MTPQETPGLTTSGLGEAERGDGGLSEREAATEPLRTWTLTILAPFIKPVTKRKTGKIFQRGPFLNSNDRDHFRVTSPITKAWRKESFNAAAVAGLPLDLPRIRIDAAINKQRAGRYDAMNYYPTVKAIVDGLIDYGICADDSNQYVTGPFITAGNKGPNAVTLTIKEIQ
jgi:hypothetical protein